VSAARCLFVSDLHGREDRYAKLYEQVRARRPAAVFLGGDLLPHALSRRRARGGAEQDFVREVIAGGFAGLRAELGDAYPRVFAILGNDDPRAEEEGFERAGADGLWDYAHGRRIAWREFQVYGYACVPPTPFQLKDWERYDVSRSIDPGCVPPEEGWRSVAADERELRHGTIDHDLRALTAGQDLLGAILLLHSPPYRTTLDRAALDGKQVDHVPLDVHVGSIAVRRFIEERGPLLTLHGHVHESARITGQWRERIGRTWAFSAAHDGPELAVVEFDPRAPESARRTLH